MLPFVLLGPTFLVFGFSPIFITGCEKIEKYTKAVMNSMRMTGSPIEKVHFQGHNLYIKRDDLLQVQLPGINSDITSQAFNGNKARKLYYYLHNDFPGVDRIISYGSAQSNMLFSLSVLAKIKGWQLDFYVDHIASSLVENPSGNYKAALDNGANIHALDSKTGELNVLNTQDYVHSYVLPKFEDALYIPEGGRNELSELGMQCLAQELKDWAESERISNPKVMLPSGTGTTALFLQKHLPFEVLTCACVGGSDYLRKQFEELSGNSQFHPRVLSPGIKSSGANNSSSERADEIYKKYHFGKPYPEFYKTWQEVRDQTGITFELLYDPLGWLCMLEYLKNISEPTNLIYLHQGGLLGNESMLRRYARKSLPER